MNFGNALIAAGVVTAAILLAGCGGTDAPTQGPEPAQDPEPTPRLTPQHDIFPISVGDTFQYSYWYTEIQKGGGNPQTSFVDSGVVSYAILDSATSGLDVTWTVHDESHILHSEFDLYPTEVPRGSPVWHHTSSTFLLVAAGSDSSRLIASSRLWTFPVPLITTWIQDSVNAFRYSSDSVLCRTSFLVGAEAMEAVHDTLIFVAGKGLTYHSQEHEGYSLAGVYYLLRIALLN